MITNNEIEPPTHSRGTPSLPVVDPLAARNYTVDFNKMQQTVPLLVAWAPAPLASTVRALRRVRVSDGSDAMDEQRAIRRQVSWEGRSRICNVG